MYRITWTIKQRDAFVKRWLKFRADHGLTQQALADAMGISVSAVARIERGRFVPSRDTVLRFASVEQRFKEGKEVEDSLQELRL